MIAQALNGRTVTAIAALVASLVVLNIGAVIAPSWIWAGLALLHYAALCWLILKAMPAAFVLLLWFIFLRLTAMLSGIAIESGGYMPEILMQGEASGAFVRLESLFLVSILGLSAFLTALLNRVKTIRSVSPISLKYWGLAVFGIVGLICLAASFIGLQNGFPALNGTDRILYWQQVDSRFLYFFLGNRPLFAVFLGLVFALSRQKPQNRFFMAAGAGLFALILLLSLLFAEKFTSIAMILFSFATPVFLLNDDLLKRLTTKLLPLGVALVIITTPAILVAYGVFDNPQAALERLQIRATSQAQLWYVEDQKTDALFRLDAERLSHNIKAMASPDAESYARGGLFLGARDYMAEYMEADRYKHYLERGVTLTVASEAYLLKLFGSIGMIVPYMILLSIYAVYLAYLFYAINTANPISLFLAAKLLVWANFALNQGYFYLLFGFKPLALLVIIAIFEIGMRTLYIERKQ